MICTILYINDKPDDLCVLDEKENGIITKTNLARVFDIWHTVHKTGKDEEMRKPLLIMCLAMVASLVGTASAVDEKPNALRFGGKSNDYAKTVCLTSDGGMVVAGYCGPSGMTAGPVKLTGSGPAQVTLVCLDKSGSVVWAKSFGGPASDMPHSVLADSSGNLYLCGYTMSVANFGGKPVRAAGKKDILLASYTSAGNHRWSMAIGGPEDDEGMDIAVSPEGNVTLVGVINGSVVPASGTKAVKGGGGEDAFIARFNKDGKLIWAQAFGGAGSDQAHGVSLTNDGFAVFLTCEGGLKTQSVNASGRGGRDIFVVSFKDDGTTRWATAIGGPGQEFAAPGGLAVSNDGTILVTGRTSTGCIAGGKTLSVAGENDILVASLKKDDGSVVWAHSIGGKNLDGGHRIASDKNGNVYVGGWFLGTVDFDPSSGVASRTSTANIGSGDAFLASYTRNGKYRGSVSWGGAISQSDNANQLIPAGNIVAGLGVTPDGMCVATGKFYQTVTMQGSSLATLLVSAGGADQFVIVFTDFINR